MTAYYLRLSRYEPGVHQSASSSWTSISDIGKSFEDGILTQAEYESVETLYLEAIDRLITDNGNPTFVVSDLHGSPTASPAAREVREGSQVRRQDVLEICRMELREELSCRLDHGEDFYVHVGFDFYVYLGCERLTPESVAAIDESGLFIEHGVPSPYSTETQV